jgi:succinate dehydrogenase/fumarate reductase flavoprotein subunit
VETDILIVGSEGAGARAAIEAARDGMRVTVTTKGKFTKSGATVTAGTDIDVDSRSICDLLGLPGDRRDTPETFLEDMIIEGKFVNDQRLVEAHVGDGPKRVKELVDWGMRVWGPQKAAGHRYNRGILSTGTEVMRALRNGVYGYKDRISILENTVVTDLLTSGGRVCGALAIDLRRGELILFNSRAVILATGGAQRLFPYTTAPEELTGDGQAMAYRLGAEMVDMQYVQFLTSTFLFPPTTTAYLNSLLVRGAWLLNRHGERFMLKWDPARGEATTRDFVAIGIMNEILEGRGWSDERGSWVLFSMRHLPENFIEELAELGDKLIASALVDMVGKQFFENLKRNGVPAFPASHFFCGGVKVDVDARSTIPGLFAAGEVSGALHGSNRLSGNAVTQVVVQGARAGSAAAQYCKEVPVAAPESTQLEDAKERIFALLQRGSGTRPLDLRMRLQKLAYQKVGVVRDADGLEEALRILKTMREESNIMVVKDKNLVYNMELMQALEVQNMIVVLEMIATSALMRTESRGVHYRRDYPERDDTNWLKHIVTHQAGRAMSATAIPVEMSRINPGEVR